MEIVSGTKIGLDVAEYVAMFCRLIVLGNGFWVCSLVGFVTLEFLSYTWIDRVVGFQSCDWVLGFPIGVGNDYCCVVGKAAIVWSGTTVVMWSGMRLF